MLTGNQDLKPPCSEASKSALWRLVLPFVEGLDVASRGRELRVVIDPTLPLLAVIRLDEDRATPLIMSNDVPADLLNAATCYLTCGLNALPVAESRRAARAIADGARLAAVCDPLALVALGVLTATDGKTSELFSSTEVRH